MPKKNLTAAEWAFWGLIIAALITGTFGLIQSLTNKSSSPQTTVSTSKFSVVNGNIIASAGAKGIAINNVNTTITDNSVTAGNTSLVIAAGANINFGKAPRALTQKQQAQILDVVKGRSKVEIVVTMGDPEAWNYATIF